MIPRKFLLLSLLTVLATGPALGQTSFEPPPDDEWDWLQLTSDEWLKGEITAMYEDTLEFESDNLGDLEIDWDDVKQLRSAGVVQIGFTDRGREAVSGIVVMDGETVTIEGETTVEFSRDEILTLRAGAPKEANYWDSKITLGGNFRSGNVDQTVYNAWARAQRRSPHSSIGLEYLGNYSETDDVENTNNHRVNGSWDLFVSDRFFVTPLTLEWYKDPLLNIDQRWTGGIGLGYVLIDSDRTFWSVGAGPGYQYIEYDTVEAGSDRTSDSFAFMGHTLFTYELTGDTDLSYDYRFFILDEENGSYTHHMVLGLTTEITSLLDLDLAWVWDRVEDPRLDEDGVLPEQDDYQIIVGLGLSF